MWDDATTFGKLVPVESLSTTTTATRFVTIIPSKSPTLAACGAPFQQYESNLKGDTSSFTRYLAVSAEGIHSGSVFFGPDFITFASSTFTASCSLPLSADDDGCLPLAGQKRWKIESAL